MKVKAKNNPRVINGSYFILTPVLYLFFGVNVLAQSPVTQTFNFPHGRATIRALIAAVQSQSGPLFIWDGELFNQDSVVDVPEGNTIDQVMTPIFSRMGLKLSRDPRAFGHPILILRATAEQQKDIAFAVYHTFRVLVRSQQGEPLEGATISLVSKHHPGAKQTTNTSGFAALTSAETTLNVRVSYVSMQDQQVTLRYQDTTRIMMTSESSLLDVTIKGYGTGANRTSTGDRTIVLDQKWKPVSGGTLLDGMAGRIPGVYITQSSGNPLSSTHINLHGVPSLLNGPDPIIIINGVPFAPNNQSVSNLPIGSAAGSSNPLRAVNLDKITRLEILKDADATAIYGSRGANGVILITTPLAKPGTPQFSFNASLGFNSLAQTVRLMNTPQYLAMRRDAFRLDGDSITPATAPDLFNLDTTSYTDWRKWSIGNITPSLNVQGSATGGTGEFSYYTSVSARHETNVFATQPAHNNFSFDLNTNFRPKNGKLTIQTSAMYGSDIDHQFLSDPTQRIFLAPVAPRPNQLLDAQNKPIAINDTLLFANPWSFLRQSYTSRIHNILLDGLATFQLFPTLVISNNLGWNSLVSSEYGQSPISARIPNQGDTGVSYFSRTEYTSLIIEPQAEFKKGFGLLQLALLAGYSYQQQAGNMSTLVASGYTNDNQLKDSTLAPHKTPDQASAKYDYHALFARLNCKWDEKYILNLTFRRDGSSLLSPEHKYGNFYAAGVGWVFTEETFIKNVLPMLSYGKLRGSYGRTGNDQVGGGHFLSGWSPTTAMNFQNIPGWTSDNKVDAGQSWETIVKTELGLDLGFVNDRFLLSAILYRNRSLNQLLPDIFNSNIWRNYPIVLENKGWDFMLTARLICRKDIALDLSFNWSLPVNRLRAFPNLATSAFRGTLIVGRSVNSQKLYKSLGVDPATGVDRILDVNHDGQYTAPDLVVIKSTDVTGFGGLTATFRCKNIQLEITADARKKTGSSYLTSVYNGNLPGSASNLYSNAPASLTDRWEKPGDQASLQRVSADINSPANKMLMMFPSTDASQANTSFVRLRNLYLSYQLPSSLMDHFWKKTAVHLFLNTQNLLTFARYKGIVETENPLVLPPFRKIEIGIHLNI